VRTILSQVRHILRFLLQRFVPFYGQKSRESTQNRLRPTGV